MNVDEDVDVGVEECSIVGDGHAYSQHVANMETVNAVSNIPHFQDGSEIEVGHHESVGGGSSSSSKGVNQIYVVRTNASPGGSRQYVSIPGRAPRYVSNSGQFIRIQSPHRSPVKVQIVSSQGSNLNVRYSREGDGTYVHPPSPSKPRLQYVKISPNQGGYRTDGRPSPPVKLIPPNSRDTASSESSHVVLLSQANSPAPAAAYFKKNEISRPPLPQKKKQSVPLGSRKPCNCTRSYCLKLYCECFANGEFCRDCNCNNCQNNMDHEVERSKAIRSCLDRNPNAFQPKIGVGARGRTEAERMHTKGCHCKKSSCLKNYCECYEAKIACTDRCRCTQCRNTEGDRASKTVHKMHAPATANAHKPTPIGLNELAQDTRNSDSPISDAPTPIPKVDLRRMPWFYMTDEVLEATALCLVAQADEMHREDMDPVDRERNILKEFGRCLHQIINNASAVTATPDQFYEST